MNFFCILDGFLAVGSRWPGSVKAEIYDFGTDDWTTVQDYPYGDELSRYDMVYIPATSAYYVIGQSEIVMFKNGAWSEAGQLNTSCNSLLKVGLSGPIFRSERKLESVLTVLL